MNNFDRDKIENTVIKLCPYILTIVLAFIIDKVQGDSTLATLFASDIILIYCLSNCFFLLFCGPKNSPTKKFARSVWMFSVLLFGMIIVSRLFIGTNLFINFWFIVIFILFKVYSKS
ncbi:MAG: hypothetical protein FWC92_03065 [Defluviitaleaceae bacterium]|nr:hypothetical protein [Defluviitaleaceae bacterium]